MSSCKRAGGAAPHISLNTQHMVHTPYKIQCVQLEPIHRGTRFQWASALRAHLCHHCTMHLAHASSSVRLHVRCVCVMEEHVVPHYANTDCVSMQLVVLKTTAPVLPAATVFAISRWQPWALHGHMTNTQLGCYHAPTLAGQFKKPCHRKTTVAHKQVGDRSPCPTQTTHLAKRTHPIGAMLVRACCKRHMFGTLIAWWQIVTNICAHLQPTMRHTTT